jgi:uncharacterized protein with von Willebrand factor type A (vWA) domain
MFPAEYVLPIELDGTELMFIRHALKGYLKSWDVEFAKEHLADTKHGVANAEYMTKRLTELLNKIEKEEKESKWVEKA